MSGQVLFSDLFSRSYDQLDGSVRKSVLDFMMKLQERPDMPGLDVKTPTGVSDSGIKTARVNDFWRAVLIELPHSRGYVLVSVKPHDDAYTFAHKLRYGVNEITGALELIDEAALQQAVRAARDTSLPDDGAGTDAPDRVLDGVRARDLRAFGVAEELAEQLVAITDADRLLAVATEMPKAQGEAVLDLAAGRGVDEVWRDLVAVDTDAASGEIDTSDMLAALERPISRLSFTSGRDTEELRAVLEGNLQAWRVWLHPLQRKLAYHDGWNGPFRVTGGAGTGKTVTAIHRATHLAQRLNQRHSQASVLFTTFTRNLAKDIQAQLVDLAGRQITERVEVMTIDALARRILATGAEAGEVPTLYGDNDKSIEQHWSTAKQAATENWDLGFLRDEWSQVVLAQGITERGGYLRVSRSGRGRRLSRPQRGDLWRVFERFTQLMRASRMMTYTQAAAEAATRAASLTGHTDDSATSSTSGRWALPQYRHAVVDEAQDLHPAHWRLLRSVVPPDTDDLFLVGDAHQRIYGKPLVLSRMGVHTRGRSRRLTVNYRTSRQILGWSMAVAHGHPADDLEGQVETLAGARSVFDGPEPELAGFETQRAEMAALIGRLQRWNDENIPWSEMVVVAHSRWQVREAQQQLSEAEIPVSTVEADTVETALGEQVRVMTMHRAKGLEYRAVAIIGAGAEVLPPKGVQRLEGEEAEAAWARERGLLYVSASRAREYLAISWTGRPSELLPSP